MRPLKEIIIHATATRPEWMASKPLKDKVAEIKRWHTSSPRNWSDIGYHYLIDRNGTIAAGRPLSRTGAHVRGRNTGTIGIALLGGHGGSENDKFADHYTPDQDAALRALIGDLMAEHGQMAVTGHNQFAAKACPCFHAPDWYAGAPVNRKYIPSEAERLIADAGKPKAASTTNWAALGGIAASAWQAIQASDPMVQAAALGVVALLVWIMRERLRKSSLGRAAAEAVGL